MKTLFFSLLVFFSLSTYGQRGHGNGRHHGHHGHHGRHGHHSKVIVKRSPYRPAAVVVYHPYWRPAYSYHRRWVYFPARNLYWDNWRNHYVFWNGTVWISQSTPPGNITGSQLEKDTVRELREDDDDVDDIYRSNDEHKKEG